MPQAAEPVSHNHGSPHARALQQGKPPYWKASMRQQRVVPTYYSESACVQQWTPTAAKKKEMFKNLAICNNIDDLEGIMLSEISQRKTIIIGPHL